MRMFYLLLSIVYNIKACMKINAMQYHGRTNNCLSFRPQIPSPSNDSENNTKTVSINCYDKKTRTWD